MKQKSSMKIKSSHWQPPVGGVFHKMDSSCPSPPPPFLLRAVPLLWQYLPDVNAKCLGCRSAELGYHTYKKTNIHNNTRILNALQTLNLNKDKSLFLKMHSIS